MIKRLEDIIDNDPFGLLDMPLEEKEEQSEENHLLESFMRVNAFYKEHGRAPGEGTEARLTEMGLASILDGIRDNEEHMQVLKPFDEYNLLGEVKLTTPELSLDDLMSCDVFGLLTGADEDRDTSILQLKHVPKKSAKRRKTDFVAQRKPMDDESFAPYGLIFNEVHDDLRMGRRKLLPFNSPEQNIKEGGVYLAGGLLCYVATYGATKELVDVPSGSRERIDGRMEVIFENGTYSNMLFRSLGKLLTAEGRLITDPEDHQPVGTLFREKEEYDLTIEQSEVSEESGWIYVLKTKHPKLSEIPHLHKIGFTFQSVEQRIANAREKSSYLYADVEVVATYRCINMNMRKLELLLHRFFGNACLDIELKDVSGLKVHPREWFVVPYEVINQAIDLLLKGTLTAFRYDSDSLTIRLR